MQAAPEKREPLAVVLDCELGSSIDNALTLALLYGLSTLPEPEAQFLAVSLTRSDLEAAAYCDAVGRFYSKIALREFPERFRRYRGFSVGLDEAGSPGKLKPLEAALSKKDAEGEPLYPHEVQEIVDTADPVALIRNALSAEQDGNCAVVLAGSAKSLAALLRLNGGPEMIRARVKHLVVAMSPDQVLADLPAARRVCSEWPTPVVAVAANDVRFPSDVAFAWTEDHPVGDVLKAVGGDVGALGMTGALFAVRQEVDGFELSEPGSLSVGDDGRLHHHPGEGDHRTLTASGTTLSALLEDLVTAEPAPREPPDFIKRILEREKKEAEEKEKKEAEEPSKG